MSNKHCSKYRDSEIMEKILKAGTSDFYCGDKSILDLRVLRDRLDRCGCDVLMVNTMEYRMDLKGCLVCYFYKGDYPSGKEVLGK